jgi:hypothetical protein
MSSLNFPLNASSKELVRSAALFATSMASSLFWVTAYFLIASKMAQTDIPTNLSDVNDFHHRNGGRS